VSPGRARSVACVKKNHHRCASKLAESTLNAVRKFQGQRDRFDDETVVALRVCGEGREYQLPKLLELPPEVPSDFER
jgi:hypothetical protein